MFLSVLHGNANKSPHAGFMRSNVGFCSLFCVRRYQKYLQIISALARRQIKLIPNFIPFLELCDFNLIGRVHHSGLIIQNFFFKSNFIFSLYELFVIIFKPFYSSDSRAESSPFSASYVALCLQPPD